MKNENDLKITLKNYGLISDAEVTFSPGLNVIVGESGNGKSTLLRGLYGTIYNDQGTSSVKAGEKISSAKIEYMGHVVEKTKTIKGNSATVKYEFDGEEYEKLGGKPLDVCVDSFKMKEIELTNSREALNFSSQFSKPFLIDESPAKIFEIMTVSDSSGNLLQILTDMKKDTAEIQKKSEMKSAEINVIKKIVSAEEEKLSSMEGVDELFEYVLESEKEIKNSETLTKEVSELSSIVTELKRIQLEHEEKEECFKSFSSLPDENVFSSLERIEEEILSISEYAKKIKETKAEQGKTEEGLSGLGFIENINPENTFEELSRCDLMKRRITDIVDIVSEINSCSGDLKSVSEICSIPTEDIEKSISLTESVSAIEDLLSSLKRIEDESKSVNEMNEDIGNLDDKSLSSLCQSISAFLKTMEMINENQKEADSVKQELDAVLNEISSVGVCPLCGQTIANHS